MADWHGYIGIEDINLNQAQRQELWEVLKARGQANDGPLPQLRNHWRFSLDVTKGIFEALFDEGQLTIGQFKSWLGAIFGVDPATIDHEVTNQVFDILQTPIVTFSRNATDYIRFVAFGGVGATWAESRTETVAYLISNAGEWETEV